MVVRKRDPSAIQRQVKRVIQDKRYLERESVQHRMSLLLVVILFENQVVLRVFSLYNLFIFEKEFKRSQYQNHKSSNYDEL